MVTEKLMNFMLIVIVIAIKVRKLIAGTERYYPDFCRSYCIWFTPTLKCDRLYVKRGKNI